MLHFSWAYRIAREFVLQLGALRDRNHVGIEIDIQATGQKGGLDFVCPAGICAAPIIGAAVVPGGDHREL